MTITMGNHGWQGKKAIWVISLVIGIILTNSDIVEFPYISPAPHPLPQVREEYFLQGRSLSYLPLSGPRSDGELRGVKFTAHPW